MFVLLYDVCFVLKGTINLQTNENDDMPEKDVVLKNNSPFRSDITKTNNMLIENAEDLDTVMPIYDLLKYSDKYSLTLESLWKYYREEIDDDDDDDDNHNDDDYDALVGKSFTHKAKIMEKQKKDLQKVGMKETMTNHRDHPCHL